MSEILRDTTNNKNIFKSQVTRSEETNKDNNKDSIDKILENMQYSVFSATKENTPKNTEPSILNCGKVLSTSNKAHDLTKPRQTDNIPKNVSEYSIPSPIYSELTVKKVHSEEVKVNKSRDFVKPHVSQNMPKKTKLDNLNLSIPVVPRNDIELSDHIIGQGGQGVVRKGKYLGSHVAIKSLQKGKYDRSILAEIKILEKIRHPNIISIMAVSSSLTNFYIVMEYFESYSLNDVIFKPKIKRLMRLDELKENKIAHELCCVIAYLHLQKVPVIHRDIKPGNVLVNNQCLTKLCDLGLGKCNDLDTNLRSTVTGRFCGTMSFMAPEIFLKRQEATVHCDIWSIACTLIELYSEKEIWDLEYSIFLFSQLQERLHKKEKPNTDGIPTKFKNIIEECLHYDPVMRPNITVLLNVFEEEPKYKA